MKIFLLGMPGSGKSTIGKLLAAKINYPFADLDKEIIEREKKTITEIFEFEGEAAFREKEAAALSDLIQVQGSMVISCGGGTPCFHSNMELMNSNGTTVFIDVPVQTLVERTKKNKRRPLLQSNHAEKIKQLLEERLGFYNKAQFIVPTKGLESRQVADILLSQLGLQSKT